MEQKCLTERISSFKSFVRDDFKFMQIIGQTIFFPFLWKNVWICFFVYDETVKYDYCGHV